MSTALSPAAERPVFVLVHGAYHGGWCWRPVAELLARAGHRALCPTLTGLGERAHLLTGEVDFSTHVEDVLAVLRFEDVRRAVLVGHSYGGLVAAAVSDRAADLMAAVVYLDSPVPVDGEAAFDVHPRGAELRAAAVEAEGVPVLPVPGTERLGIDDPALAEWVRERLTPQPVACQTEPVRLRGDYLRPPKTYIRCLRNPSRRPYLERVDPERGWRMRLIDTGHDAMLSAPAELAELLLAVAAEGSSPEGVRGGSRESTGSGDAGGSTAEEAEEGA